MPPKKKLDEPRVTKQFILDHLEENEVDLSMCGLSKVPVRELAMVPRGTRLDVSRNQFTSLPDTFCSLRHLIELDLSDNQLTELPLNFGQLSQLQRVDLYSNQLTTLPLSFSQLKSLKWLDLKNNPLDEGLAADAGLCLSERECKDCAKKVLVHMKELYAEAERRRQKELEAQRALELRQEAEEQAKKEEVRKERTELRRRRRKEQELKEEAERKAMEAQDGEEEEEEREKGTAPEAPVASSRPQRSCFQSCLQLSCVLLLLLLVLLFALYQTSWPEPLKTWLVPILTILAPPSDRDESG